MELNYLLCSSSVPIVLGIKYLRPFMRLLILYFRDVRHSSTNFTAAAHKIAVAQSFDAS